MPIKVLKSDRVLVTCAYCKQDREILFTDLCIGASLGAISLVDIIPLPQCTATACVDKGVSEVVCRTMDETPAEYHESISYRHRLAVNAMYRKLKSLGQIKNEVRDQILSDSRVTPDSFDLDQDDFHV
jgi:hypothetical protein